MYLSRVYFGLKGDHILKGSWYGYFGPAQMNHTKGKNEPESDSTELNSTGLKDKPGTETNGF